MLDVDANARAAVAVDPALVLDGATPRLIDEWQIEPAIWNHVRRAVDDRAAPGQFILTGSAVPADDVTRHTGAGRLTRLRMRPMSLYECGVGTTQISLAALLAGEPARSADAGVTVAQLAQEVAVGGWLGLRDLPVDRAQRAVRDYLEEIRRVDVPRVDGVRRDPAKVGALLRSLARNVATHAAATTLARGAGGADGPLTNDTDLRVYAQASEADVLQYRDSNGHEVDAMSARTTATGRRSRSSWAQGTSTTAPAACSASCGSSTWSAAASPRRSA